MGNLGANSQRVKTDGKFFRLRGAKFYLRGVAYGPFPPNPKGEPFKSPEDSRRDFNLLQALHANVIRVYEVPPRWFLDLAQEYDLRVFVDVPWNRQRCFLDSAKDRAEIINQVKKATRQCAGHPAFFALSVGNEIPPDIVRWYGARKVERFIRDLIWTAKDVDPECLCTYANYPSTEFLEPPDQDFICFNVYLHTRHAFEAYVYKLHHLADECPLVLGEIGMDSLREGEIAQAKFLEWQIETAFECGTAGLVVFNFTDEWYVGGKSVDDWAFGLTTTERRPKLAFEVVKEKFLNLPVFNVQPLPRVSVVVPAWNAAPMLEACLQSLNRLDYPDYEIIVVDDGSTDETPNLVKRFPRVRYIRHDRNLGLGTARNTGIAAATGEIVAFTDADCVVDEHWLTYLVKELVSGDYVCVGGPNLPPLVDDYVATAVRFAPGNPRHVMLSHTVAEHVPGCNMAFYKWVFDRVGGFDPVFTRAGDDVDICWRVQDAGYKIGFAPAAVVWHHRRSTLTGYLRQQIGYGEAEALLVKKHPRRFSFLGTPQWRGRIYKQSLIIWPFQKILVYHGRFASAPFQPKSFKGPGWELTNLLCTVEYLVLLVVPMTIVGLWFHGVLVLAAITAILPLISAVYYALIARVPEGKDYWWVRSLIALMHLLGPFVRNVARHKPKFQLCLNCNLRDSWKAISLRKTRLPSTLAYWVEGLDVDRMSFLQQVLSELEKLGCPYRLDSGWEDFDLELLANTWVGVRLQTACELYPEKRRLIRCRLWTIWTPTTKLCFVGLIALGLALLRLQASSVGWLAILMGGALCLWVLRLSRKAKSEVIVLLDELAEGLGLVKLNTKKAPEENRTMRWWHQILHLWKGRASN